MLLKKIGPPSAQATKVVDAKAAEHDVKKLKFRLGSGAITAGMLNLMKYVFMNFHEIEARHFDVRSGLFRRRKSKGKGRVQTDKGE